MKTKEELLNEVVAENTKIILANPRALDESALNALKNRDLAAITSKVMAQVIVHNVITNTNFLAKDDNDKEIILFKTIFQSLRMMRLAEEKYEEQFKVEEK